MSRRVSQTKEALIKSMMSRRILKSPHIIAAFRAIDRKDFIRMESLPKAYADEPLSIGFGQTISQPSTVAFMLEQLDVHPGYYVLDVGSGSGWTTALLAHITGPGGVVIGVERISELVDFGKDNLRKYDFSHAEIMLAGTDMIGLPNEGPFDRILVSATADSMPEELIHQLTPEGRMVIPVGSSLYTVTKITNGSVEEKEYPGFAFVSLIK